MKKLLKKESKLQYSIFAGFASLGIFWILVFTLARLIFLIYNREELRNVSFTEFAGVFVNAFPLDISTASYFLAPSYLILLAAVFSRKRIFYQVLGVLSTIFLIVVALITVSELPIYDEWSHKLTYKAVWFLQNPSEVIHTASYSQLFGGTIAIIAFVLLGRWIYRKVVLKPEFEKRSLIELSIFTVLTPLLLVVGLRGGFQPIPRQVSDAYFSEKNFLNLAAVNSVFHLASNVLQNMEARKPYDFMPSHEAEQIVNELYTPAFDSSISFLSTSRPNVVLFILEGWAADVLDAGGQYQDIAPFMRSLIRRGIYFDSCYASGNLSDQGIGAVLSAFPAQPRTSIITVPTRYSRLPLLNRCFLDKGYRTSFLFGGQLSYGNIKSYIYYNGFNTILEEKDFPSETYRGRLGVHDGDLFERQLAEINKGGEPFFASMFTLSTHGPYDFPGERPLDWGGKEKDYINSVHYADKALRTFMEKASKQLWFDNTLFVFVSDHHHNSPMGHSYYQPEYRRIPLIFYGNPIREEFRGMVNHSICSQLDLATTLTKQLDCNSQKFPWSRDLFNPGEQEFAFYTFDEGFGWIRPEGRLVWYAANGRFEFERYKNPEEKTRLFKEGRAYLQRVTEEFWKD